MCHFRGRINYQVYIPDKPQKWWMKIFEVLYEGNNGYVWSMEIHAGNISVSDSPHDVVIRLMDSLLDSGCVCRQPLYAYIP